jgi:hypothetical protein
MILNYSQNFRSSGPHFGNAAPDASFDQFQRAQAGLPNNLSPGPNPGLALPASSAPWSIGHRIGQAAPTAHLDSQGEHWTDEFARLSLAHGQAAARHANGAPLVPYPVPLSITEVEPAAQVQYFHAPPGTQPNHFLPDPRGAHYPLVGVIRNPLQQPMQQMGQVGHMQHMLPPSSMMAQMQYQPQYQHPNQIEQERKSHNLFSSLHCLLP